jgi:hypothetical protein
VHDPHARVKTDRVAGQDRLTFEQGVQVVEHRAARVRRQARAFGDQRTSLPEAQPVLGHLGLVCSGERQREL